MRIQQINNVNELQNNQTQKSQVVDKSSFKSVKVHEGSGWDAWLPSFSWLRYAFGIFITGPIGWFANFFIHSSDNNHANNN